MSGYQSEPITLTMVRKQMDLQNDDPQVVQGTIKYLNQLIADKNMQVMRNYKKIVRSKEWQDKMALENSMAWNDRFHKRQANHRKKYCIPEVLYNANMEYWKQAVKDDKHMKKYHPELIVKEHLKTAL